MQQRRTVNNKNRSNTAAQTNTGKNIHKYTKYFGTSVSMNFQISHLMHGFGQNLNKLDDELSYDCNELLSLGCKCQEQKCGSGDRKWQSIRLKNYRFEQKHKIICYYCKWPECTYHH